MSSCNAKASADINEMTDSTHKGDTIKLSGQGVLIQLEDSGYPMAWAAILDESQSDTIFCQLNFADISDLDPGLAATWVQKVVEYTAVKYPEKSLLDVYYESTSLLAGENQILLSEMEKCTGILSGAMEPTAGDLPDQIRIHDPEGESLVFNCFITPEMAKAEGSMVTGYYRIDHIVALKKLSRVK